MVSRNELQPDVEKKQDFTCQWLMPVFSLSTARRKASAIEPLDYETVIEELKELSG